MALFFDSEWFDARLAAAGLTPANVAAALALDAGAIAEMWKDQREVRAQDVRVLAGLLGVSQDEVAKHAGISSPRPRDLAVELARIGDDLAEIKSLLRALMEKFP